MVSDFGEKGAKLNENANFHYVGYSSEPRTILVCRIKNPPP